MNDFSQVGCIDVYERTLGPTPSTTLVTKGPTGGFGANEAFGPDIEVGVGASRDGRRYYFYSDEQLTSADTYGAAYDLYVSAAAETGGYPRPKGATKIFASLVPAFTACNAPNRTHGPPLGFGSCNPPGPASSSLTVGGSGGGSPALSSGYVQLHAPFDPPGPPDGADVNVTVHLSNVMRRPDLSMARRIARWKAPAAHFRRFRNLTPEDQTQHESNSERREYCFCWIFTDVLLGIFLERTSAARGIAPRLFRFAACFAPGLLRLASVFFRKSACG